MVFFFGASSSLPSAFGLRRLDVRDGFFSGGASSSLKNSLGLRRPSLGIVRFCAQPPVLLEERVDVLCEQ